MFYEAKIENKLRFGDVLKGFITTDVEIKKPISNLDDPENNFKINFDLPLYTVVLTPCCSIEDGAISITPLKQVKSDFFKNEHFQEELTIINRKMSPVKMLPKVKWDKLPDSEKTRRMTGEETYAQVNFFIYDKHDLLIEYDRRGKKVRYYMIDFKNVIYLKCDKIKRGKGDEQIISDEILNAKILQLTPSARCDLREKLGYFYSRPTVEDEIALNH